MDNTIEDSAALLILKELQLSIEPVHANAGVWPMAMSVAVASQPSMVEQVVVHEADTQYVVHCEVVMVWHSIAD